MKLRYIYLLIGISFLWTGKSVLAQDTSVSEDPPASKNTEATNPYDLDEGNAGMQLDLPSNVTPEVEYDAENGEYILKNTVGSFTATTPYSMSFDEFRNYDADKSLSQFWTDRYRSESFEHQGSFIPKINIGSQAFETIFGGSTIDIRAQGSATLKFGIKIAKIDNPNQPEDLRTNTTFDFDEQIRMNVTGKVGENLEMKVSYDTESQFDFDNTMNIRYQGQEDDIIQKIEVGDVSLPLSTSLITGSQSLFGVLSELKFGNLYITAVASQQEGETKTINVEGGAQKTEFELPAVEYDKNRHFFLAHRFRQTYDASLSNLPTVNSSITITNVEVWVTNTTKSTEDARNILALLDLGEENNSYDLYGETVYAINKRSGSNAVSTYGQDYPDNDANSLYQKVLGLGDSIRSPAYMSQYMKADGYTSGTDFEKVEYARKLGSNEYTLHDRLGYISLNSALNADEVLAVAYQYTTTSGEVKQVGEFTTDMDSTGLIVKLLKGTNFSPKRPNWDLMMKNIYAIGGYQVDEEDFNLEVEYYDDETGTNLFNLPNPGKKLDANFVKQKLLKIMQLDTLNSRLEPGSDGVFDFVEDAVIRTSNGRVMFPTVEPFGGFLRELLEENTIKGNSSDLTDRFVFNELYDSTQYQAEQVTSKNKFFVTGSFKASSGSEIFLNAFNIPEGSVTVTAGGITLTENIDYTVDYNMGRVSIINESYLASGTSLKITVESNNLFSIQSKTLLGTHMEYRFSEDFNLGATIMNLTERPLTEKVTVGDEPLSNTIWGINGSYRTDVPFLTRMIDFLPFIETKEMSSITVEGEFAQLIPGHNNAIGESGNAYIDDFEGSESTIDLRNRTGWMLASTPEISNLFPESEKYNNLAQGYNRAKLAWYQIDPLFFRSSSPVDDDEQSKLLVYRAREQDIFPNKETTNGIPTEISTLDLAFYPDERGPYNYDAEGLAGISSGLDENGKLKDPETRWGGIMRELSTTDFESTNVEYIRFWIMDPFVEENEENEGGYLYFNLGSVSEDVLKDGRKSYENGLSTETPPDPSSYAETSWGRVPLYQTSTQAFVNDADLRSKQDIGMDGLASTYINEGSTSDEANFFSDYLSKIQGIVTNATNRAEIEEDPSADDFIYFRDSRHDANSAGIMERYKWFNNQEGNSPASSGSSTYSASAQSTPDVEDINSDFTLSENEAFFQYRVAINQEMLEAQSGYVTDMQTASITMENGETKNVNWYQFKVPIADYESSYGEISDFRSIRFMRMYMRGWSESIVLRFAQLELVRSEWQKYDYTLKEKTESDGDDDNYDPSAISFSISTVNIEENASRTPVNYVLPPGVDRQQDPSNPQLTQLNEQSLSMTVDSLEDGYAKAIYKTLNMDMRDYQKLQMFIHAEQRDENLELNDNDLTCFIRLGSDYTDNYYEYEVPLQVTPEWTGRPYDDDDSDDRYIVWPEANNMVVDFDELVSVKEERNDARRESNSTVSLLTPYSTYDDDGRKITVKGNPSLSNVVTVMIGVRNPLAKYNALDDDEKMKSAEIWINELRMTDFRENGGWAATGQMTARLADLGNVTVAGSTIQPGFGSIEQSASDRAKEETNQVDMSANIQMGKFFPEKANVRIPVNIGYSRTAINPQYNPLDEDVLMENYLNNDNISDAEKEELLSQVQDLTERKSINFNNVGIGRSGKGTPHFYSPSNVSVSYAYSQVNHNDISTEYEKTRYHSGGINYVFNNRPKNITPFKKVNFLQKPALKLIGDFNFYYAPSQVSLSTSVDREYNETLLRNLENETAVYTPTYEKNFDWDRSSSVKYNFSKGLKFEFSTKTNAYIDEPDGLIDKSDQEAWEQYKEEIYNSFLDFGRPNSYNQTVTASYDVPISKIPGFNWLSVNSRYSGMYYWNKATGTQDQTDSLYLGNTIKNSQKITLNAQGNMNKLYNSAEFIKKIDKKYKQSRERRKRPRTETKEVANKLSRLNGGKAKRITHNLSSEEDIKVKVLSAEGKEVPSSFEIMNENRIAVTVEEDIKNVTVTVSAKVQVKDSPLLIAYEHGVLLLTGFKQVSASLSQTNGSVLPGFMPSHRFGSLSTDPGLPFILGFQSADFAQTQMDNAKLITTESVISPYIMTSSVNWNFKATYQPVRAFRIDFGAKYITTGKQSEYYYDAFEDPVNRVNTNSYNLNIWMLSSSFQTPSREDISSAVYEKYKENLITLAWRKADERAAAAQLVAGEDYDPGEDRTSMPEGYSITNPEVAIPAFIAAYTDQDAHTISTAFFNNWALIRPTWRVKYDGLKNYDFIKKRFKNITLSNAYSATFSVGSMTSNVTYDYVQAESQRYQYMSWIRNTVDTTLFVPEYAVSSFTASEKFSPLIGIDMTWKNNVLTSFEYAKSRDLSMSLTNSQLLEVYSQAFVIGTGYRFDKLRVVVNGKPIVNDLNIRADLSIQNTLSITRSLSEDYDDITAGQKTVALSITADYAVNDKLTFQGYITHDLTNPAVSSSYKTANTEFGFQVQFSLAQ